MVRSRSRHGHAGRATETRQLPQSVLGLLCGATPIAPGLEGRAMGQHNGASSPSSCTCLQQLLSAAQKPGVLRTALYNGALILTWYTLSTLLSLYNKQLLGRDGKGIYGKGAFPAPLLMSALQFALQHLLARLVFLTGLVSRTNKPDMGWMAYLRNVVPNGITTGLDIGFSNMSLVFITMSFYTMCKSTVPVYLLLFAFLWRIEKPSWELAAVVAIICSGLVLLVEGESSFNAIGFALVMTASCLAGLRFTLTQVLLHGHQDAGKWRPRAGSVAEQL
ncbi:TPT domain-containing protein [Haematococcus lacustris]|uniref:TPT domain-containing protein n=1 Tax=Haematococcus lacustris TaxID=44745 RepID=A0A699ZXK0_HAELA|nr:TPT domain-containing protein [Haematococcus lacustris]